MKLDFADFHPLDHSLLACKGYPGGRRRHASYEWDFRTEPWLRSHTTCKMGRHESRLVYGRAAVGEPWHTWEACVWCASPLSEKTPSEPPLWMIR